MLFGLISTAARCSSFVGPWSRPTRDCWHTANSTMHSADRDGGRDTRDARTGRNGRHTPVGLLRQSVFGRLAGYEDVKDGERLRHDPAIRWIVGGTAAHSNAASPSQ